MSELRVSLCEFSFKVEIYRVLPHRCVNSRLAETTFWPDGFGASGSVVFSVFSIMHFIYYLRFSVVSWQGQHGMGDKKYPAIMLEAVASQDLWIWHAFYGVAGANNDINILDNSPLFDNLLNDTAPVVLYVVNGVGYEKGYYLADGIYPQWATFVKSFAVANDAKHAYFKKRQKGARKDVERAFGVLQGRWGIIQQPARSYHVNTLRRVIVHGLKGVKLNVEKIKKYETEIRIERLSSGQFLPLVSLDKIAKVFKEGENGPTVEQRSTPVETKEFE
nr:protein ALP1-like [Tanacetum cinerariifolium]